MSDYFTRFMQQTRSTVDPELASRWKYDAARNGDKTIRAQMATARRTATTLEKSILQFSNLRPEQELAMKAAASAMRALADDMQALASWAKAYHQFCEQEYKKDRAAALEVIAAQRWGTDEGAMAFELALMQELKSAAGRAAFARWMHPRCGLSHIAPDRIWPPIDLRIYPNENIRTSAARAIEEGRDSNRRRHVSYDSSHLHCAWSDYDEYLAYRKDMAKTTARVMQMSGLDAPG